MPINLNISNIQDIRLQSTEVGKVYLGTQLVYERTKNIFVFNVSAGQTIKLQSSREGAPYTITDWGDGNKDYSINHTYSSAGVYTVSTTFSLTSPIYVSTVSEIETTPRIAYEEPVTYQMDQTTLDCLVQVKGICDTIKNLDGFFYNCRYLKFEDISFGKLNMSKVDTAFSMFEYVGKHI